MRRAAILAILTTLMLAPASVGAGAAGQADADPPRLLISPAPTDEWKASLLDVQHVLLSAAAELWVYFPERRLKPIIVAPKGGPIVWFKRGLNGEYFVCLNTGKTYWAQYAYQFAHEFCHILCGYEPSEKANKWFEESLCEMASLFALRRMAETWKTKPPYPNWRDFSEHLHSYADDRIKKSGLPDGTPLAAWYRQNEAALRKNSTDRDRNNIVAVALLPLFEAEPDHWAAVEYLNAAPSKTPRSFQQYLAAWHRHAPKEHKAFIRKVAQHFGVEVVAATAGR